MFILAYISDDNDIIRRSFQFPHDSSLANEWNNYLELHMSKSNKNKMTLLQMIMEINHLNNTNELSDKLITRVLSHSIVVAMSFPTVMLKISCILH